MIALTYILTPFKQITWLVETPLETLTRTLVTLVQDQWRQLAAGFAIGWTLAQLLFIPISHHYPETACATFALVFGTAIGLFIATLVPTTHTPFIGRYTEWLAQRRTLTRAAALGLVLGLTIAFRAAERTNLNITPVAGQEQREWCSAAGTHFIVWFAAALANAFLGGLFMTIHDDAQDNGFQQVELEEQ